MIFPPSPSAFRKLQNYLAYSKAKSRASDSSASREEEKRKEQEIHFRNETGQGKAMFELFSYAVLWWSLLGIYYLGNSGGWVSRRLVSAFCFIVVVMGSFSDNGAFKANFPYVIWIAAYNTTFIFLYLLVFESAVPHFIPSKPDLPTLHPQMQGIANNSNLHPSRAGSPYQTEFAVNEEERSKRIAPPLLEAINKNGLVLFLIVRHF